MKKIIVYTVVIILLFLGIVISLTNSQRGRKKVKTELSLVEKQAKEEAKFKIDGYTIDKPNIIVDPYKSSPLTALILFETKDKVSPKVTVVGKDKKTTITHQFKSAKKHYLSIYGLYPDSENEVIVEYKEVKKTYKIKTDKLPDDFIIPTSVKADKSKLGSEFYFFSPSSTGYTAAYDINGDVRWYLSFNAIWDIEKLNNGHLLVGTERLINSPYYVTGLYEIDMFGKIYTEYSLEGGYHHDYYEMPNGNLLVASDNFGNSDGTVEDYVVELDRKTGKVVKSFDLRKILNMEDSKSENWTSYDWFHNNSVWYDEKTNSITLSGRHKDAVINIDYKSGNLNWIIGDSTNWSKEYQKYFFKPVGKDFEWQWSQHAAMITPKGEVFLFDNGNNKSKNKEDYVEAKDSYSRGVIYKIDTEKMEIKQVFEYGKERGSDFYSPYISDVDYLSDNHYIIHSGGIVSVDGTPSNKPAGLTSGDVTLKADTVELLDNKVIFEITLPANFYRVEKMNIYGNDELKLGKVKRLGSLGKTKVAKKKLNISKRYNKNSSEYKKHKISFTKEIDRLVLKGQFKREDKVNVVLVRNGIASYSNIKVSKKPYTALCVDIFTEEENKNGITISRYINKEGLSGIYSIFIEINGKLYDTNETVEF